MTGHFLVDWLQLALSLFCCILLLWLGLTLLLNSEQRTGAVLLVSGTAFLASTFFAAHTSLLQIAPYVATDSLDFWWRTGWLMLAALPYGWYVIVLWFGGYTNRGSPLRRCHRYAVVVLGVLMAGLLLALVVASPLPSFAEVLSLQTRSTVGIWGLPWLLVVYPLYTLACILLALAALRAIPALDEADVSLARRRAQPWLLATTGLLAAVGLLVVAAIGWFQTLPYDGTVSVAALLAGAAWFDLAASALLAAAIVLIGQAMVHYEIVSGRTLPRRELRRHWNYALVLAAGYGLVAGGSLAYGLRPVYDLLLAAVLMAALFALTGWRTFNRQQAFVRRLQPFVASTHLYAQLTTAGAQPSSPDGPGQTAAVQDAESTLAALCRDVLNTEYAALLASGPPAMLTPQPLTYPSDAPAPPAGDWLQQAAESAALILPLRLPDAPQVAWVLPLRSGAQLLGVLLLSERSDGGLYTEEEIEVAKAAGERLIDLRAGVELAQQLLQVQRTRLVESTLLDRQTRRVLHDDVLPELHTALLLLNQTPSRDLPADLATPLAAANDLLISAHRRIAELLHALPPRPALQPDGGLLPSLRRLLEGDFADEFDRVEWEADAEAEALAAALPAVTAEVVFYALREALRNAARHGRGGDELRRLTLRVRLWNEGGLHIAVEDNGVGADPNGDLPSSNGGHGLALHTAMLAVVGATMTVRTTPARGTHLIISLPAM